MPNWVRNKVIVGRKEYVDAIRKRYCSIKENGVEDFDFDKVIKRPEELDIEFSSKSNDGLNLYMTLICPDAGYFGKREDKISKKDWDSLSGRLEGHVSNYPGRPLTKEETKKLHEKYKDKIPEAIELGKKQIENLKEYGALNWYEWSIKHWGSKWNSDSFEVSKEGYSFTFETAWSPALPIIVEISKQNPTVKFAYLYSDENIGFNAGYALIHNGKTDFEGSFRDQSPDAYMLAFDLWGCREDYRWDEKEGTYLPVEEQEEASM